MRDIGAEVRDYIDAVAPPIDLDEVKQARPIVLSRGRSQRVRLAAVVVAAAAVVVVAVAVVAHHDTRDTVGAGAPTEAPAWYAGAGEVKTAPPVPAGWTPVDVLDFRFAIPPHWAVTSCGFFPPPADAVGAVVVVEDAAAPCDPLDGGPAVSARVTIRPGDPSQYEGRPTTVGALPAKLVVPICPEGGNCVPWYVLPNGTTIEAVGPDTDRVLGTFTDSGARQVLQRGPLVDTTDWRLVSYDGVEFRVPATWSKEDLRGSVTQSGGQVDPGVCGGPMFAADESPHVLLGHGLSAAQVSCAAVPYYDASVADGVWIRDVAPGVEAAQVESLPVIARKTVNGLDLSILRPAAGVESAPHPPLELLIRRGTGVVRVTLGIGLDPAIARTVLQTLRATS